MSTWLERIVARWLRMVAPHEWPDTVVGDLREDLGAEARTSFRMTAAMAAIALRLTLDALGRSIRAGWRALRSSSLRQATRSLWRAPGYTVVGVLTLALAIGANTAIYSALRAVVLDPFPVKDGERYVIGWHSNPEMAGVLIPPPAKAVDAWRTATHVVEAIEAFTGGSGVLTDAGEPEELSISYVSSSLFSTLGVSPIIGRLVMESDTRADAPPVVVISHVLWVTRFGGDPAIVGRHLALGETAYTVIGVMPRRFYLPLGSEVLWAAARPGRSTSQPTWVRTGEQSSTLIKLRAGVTIQQSELALQATTAGSDDDELKGWSPALMALSDYHGKPVKNALPVLTAAVGLLLLIACVNVTNLTLTRNAARQRELGVRFALGASRGRLVGALLLESLILAAAGGVLGLVVAEAGLSVIAALRPQNLDVLDRVYLDGSTMIFAAAVSCTAGLLLGIIPGLMASRVNLQALLASGGRTATSSQHRARGFLTVAQVAVALVLVVGASLLIRSYARLTAVDPGFDPSNLLTVNVSLPSARYPVKEPARRTQFFDQVLTSINSLPGVRSVAIGNGIPPATGIMFGSLVIKGRTLPGNPAIFAGGYVSPGYFSTLAIPLVEGRVFTDEDTIGRERVVIVSESVAQTHWPGRSPIGEFLRLQDRDEWARVVGVVRDVKAVSLASSVNRPQVYFPRAQVQPGFGAFIVKTSGNPMNLAAAVKSRVWEADPKLPIREIATGDDVLRRDTSQARFNLVLLTAFAVSGLSLVIVGVYGVTALFVHQRTREMGIRLALGATRAAVITLVLRQTGMLLVIGLVLGSAVGIGVSRYLESLLFGTRATDPVSFVAAAAVIGLSALAATLVPLRRASALTPTSVLRAD